MIIRYICTALMLLVLVLNPSVSLALEQHDTITSDISVSNMTQNKQSQNKKQEKIDSTLAKVQEGQASVRGELDALRSEIRKSSSNSISVYVSYAILAICFVLLICVIGLLLLINKKQSVKQKRGESDIDRAVNKSQNTTQTKSGQSDDVGKTLRELRNEIGKFSTEIAQLKELLIQGRTHNTHPSSPNTDVVGMMSNSEMPASANLRVYYIERIPSQEQGELKSSYEGTRCFFQVTAEGVLSLRDNMSEEDKRSLIQGLRDSIPLVTKRGQGAHIREVTTGKVTIDTFSLSWKVVKPLEIELYS